MQPTIAHNLYLEILIAVGPIGFIIFLWGLFRFSFIYKGLLSIYEERHRCLAIGILAALVAQFVGGVTFGMFYENRVLWTAVGLTLSVFFISKKMGIRELIKYEK